MISNIRSPSEVTIKEGRDRAVPEQSGMLRCPGLQRFGQQRPERTAQPFVRGYIESDLRAAKDRGRKLIFH